MFFPHIAGTSLLRVAILSIGTVTAALAQSGDKVQRIPLPPPNADFPISAAVVVPPGYETIYISGTVPQAINANAQGADKYGDTKTQTISALKQIQPLR